MRMSLKALGTIGLLSDTIWGALVGFGVWRSIQRGWLPVDPPRGRLGA